MKVLLMGLLVLSFTGCGLQRQIDELKNRTGSNSDEIISIKARLSALETQRAADKAQLQILGDSLTNSTNGLNAQLSTASLQISHIVSAGAATQEQVDILGAALANAVSAAATLQGRVSTVEGSTVVLQSNVGTLQTDLAALQAYVNTMVNAAGNQFNLVGNAITNLENNATAVNASLNVLQSSMTSLQSSSNSALAQIAVLQGYNNIVSIKDPCGAQGAYNEVFLKLSNGTYIASFSDNAAGQNTRFTVLTDGTFQTTDGTHCNFTVSGGGTVISNEHN